MESTPRTWRDAVVLFSFLLSSSAPAAWTPLISERFSPSPLTAGMKIQATDGMSGIPLPNAQVWIPELNLAGQTDPHGSLFWQAIPIKEAVMPVSVRVYSSGYGDWEIQRVRLIAGDTLILKPALDQDSHLNVVPPPRAENPVWNGMSRLEGLDPQTQAAPLVTLPHPERIRIRVSAPLYPWPDSPYKCDTKRAYTLKVVDFKQYVKNVLPNEWGARWPAESLRSGAMAVKTYAWFMVALGGKWPDADVWDSTCDQVYNPNIEYESTNAAVDYIWEKAIASNGKLFATYYRAYYYQCVEAGLAGKCMGQWDSKDLADAGSTWDEILFKFYDNTALTTVTPPAVGGYQLRYYGNATNYNENRVMINIDDPNSDEPGPPVDIGGDDFTIEWWLKADLGNNDAAPVACGANQNWVFGNILIDRTINQLELAYGASLAGGKLIFGATNGADQRTICSQSSLTDGFWHHIALQRRRSDGHLWIFIDGRLEIHSDGPDGDLSYPDTYKPDLDSDPYLGIGAWKDATSAASHPFFLGWMDEVRISSILRYTAPFARPYTTFAPDKYTLALYHFDEGLGDLITDVSAASGGTSHASRETGSPSYGGDPLHGTEWDLATLFSETDPPRTFLPIIIQ